MSKSSFQNEFKRIVSLIREHERFLILGHVDPDGDCIGSILALTQYLITAGKDVRCYAPGEIPEVYEQLPCFDRFVTEGELSGFDSEVIFSLDVPTPRRTADLAGSRSELVVVNIDHHPTNENFGAINIVDETAGATAVLVYRLLADIDPEGITSGIADCLFVGILLDTGGFRFQNSDAEVFATAAKLIEHGARAYELTHEFIHAKKFNALKLLALALDSLRIHSGGRIATMEISMDMLARSGGFLRDTEGFIDYAGAIDHVELCALFREITPDQVRVSLRSRNDYDVAELAEQYGGGGHRNAAGLVMNIDLEAAKSRIIQDLEKLTERMDSNKEAVQGSE
ncbi:MAG: bifunctional oligoribonuclease/PAP phosphatase NrnA [bacterium]|nr:MAG: bifunctional oligoribonuclease/PAP phosphatase NrnA [bacterium]